VVRYITAAIETLQVGDWVITRDEHDADGELALTQIAEKFERTAYHLRQLTLESSNGHSQTLPTTNEHPAYDPDTGLWRTAGEFAVGERFRELPGDESVVSQTVQENHREGVKVYNFRLVEGHTYFVRAAGSEAEPVWVHNTCRVEWSKTVSHESDMARMEEVAEAISGHVNRANELLATGGDHPNHMVQAYYDAVLNGDPYLNRHLGSAFDSLVREFMAGDPILEDVIINRGSLGGDRAIISNRLLRPDFQVPLSEGYGILDLTTYAQRAKISKYVDSSRVAGNILYR